MLPLIETIIGFSAIMLMLSLLVKSLTSVLKTHYNYYANNLEREFLNLVRGTFEELNETFTESHNQLLKNINWKRLGEEYFTKDNVMWWMKKINIDESKLDLTRFKARLEIHKANIRFVFENNNKKLSVFFGLSLCLFANINAFSLWDQLYNDQQLRAQFSSEAFVDGALKEFEQASKEPENNGGDTEAAKEKNELEKQFQQQKDKFFKLRRDIHFGVGKIWSGEVDTPQQFFYEFFGSLLTGLLISIGAPYWQDILRMFSELRKKKTAKAKKAGVAEA